MDKESFIKAYLAPLMCALDPGIEEIMLTDRPKLHQLILIKHKNHRSHDILDITNRSNAEIAFISTAYCMKNSAGKGVTHGQA